MRHLLSGCLAVLLALSATNGFAQGAAPKGATDLTHVEIQTHLKKAVQESISDRILSLVDVGAYNVAAAVVIRYPPSGSNKGVGNIGAFLSHDKISEIYYVIRGSGTQLTGGTMIGGKPNPGGGATGPGVGGGTRIEGGRSSHLVAGDVQVIPPGVPHGWTSVDPGGIEYMVFRVDPEKVLRTN